MVPGCNPEQVKGPPLLLSPSFETQTGSCKACHDTSQGPPSSLLPLLRLREMDVSVREAMVGLGIFGSCLCSSSTCWALTSSGEGCLTLVACVHSLIHSFIHLLTQSLLSHFHSIPYSLGCGTSCDSSDILAARTGVLTHSLIHSLAHSLTHSLTHSPTHACMHPSTHPSVRMGKQKEHDSTSQHNSRTPYILLQLSG